MKKLLTVILLTTVSLTLSGCFSKGYKSDTHVGREQAEEILRCFNEDDIEGLKSMFCKEVSNTYNLDEEIAEAMNFFDGKAISHDKVRVAGGDSIREGRVVDRHIDYSIFNIKTNSNKNYRIVTHSYLVYDKNSDCIGITYLKVIDSNTNQMVQIGEYVY